MNKKGIIVIAILVVVALIVIGIILKINVKNEEKSNRYSDKILTEEERKVSRKENIESIVEILKDGGIKLTDKQDCVSNNIDEEGYSYKVDNQTIEIYELDRIKLDSLIQGEQKSLEVRIKVKENKPINAICFNNTLILNSMNQVKQKIIDILEQQQ